MSENMMSSLKNENSCVYLIQDGRWLMLLRNKKANDLNEGKYIGIGGKKEPDESIRACALREFEEETGAIPLDLTYRGRVYFQQGEYTEQITFYTAHKIQGTLHENPEGTMEWIAQEQVLSLPLWEGDRPILRHMLQTNSPFTWRMIYDNDGHLMQLIEEEVEEE